MSRKFPVTLEMTSKIKKTCSQNAKLEESLSRSTQNTDFIEYCHMKSDSRVNQLVNETIGETLSVIHFFQMPKLFYHASLDPLPQQ